MGDLSYKSKCITSIRPRERSDGSSKPRGARGLDDPSDRSRGRDTGATRRGQKLIVWLPGGGYLVRAEVAEGRWGTCESRVVDRLRAFMACRKGLVARGWVCLREQLLCVVLIYHQYPPEGEVGWIDPNRGRSPRFGRSIRSIPRARYGCTAPRAEIGGLVAARWLIGAGRWLPTCPRSGAHICVPKEIYTSTYV